MGVMKGGMYTAKKEDEGKTPSVNNSVLPFGVFVFQAGDNEF